MQDVTHKIELAVSREELWVDKIFLDAVSEIETLGYSVSYWPDEENWASILCNGIVCGYLCRHYPLVMLGISNITCIEVLNARWDFVVDIIAKDINKDVFEFCTNCFSDNVFRFMKKKYCTIEDIWFFTNSI